jgi:O-antigen ligase
LGGQGFAPLAGVAALLLLPVVARGLRPRWYMAGLVLFFIWASVTVLWSPANTPLVSFDAAKGALKLRREVMAALTVPAVAILLAATERLDEKGRRLVIEVAKWAMLVQLVMVAILALFENQFLEMLRPLVPNTGEGVQNISRNSLIMAAAAPFLIQALVQDRTPRIAILIVLAVLAVESAVLIHRGVNAGLLAMVLAVMAIAIVAVFRTHGFKIIGSGMAMLVWTAPMFFGFLSLGAEAENAHTSSEQRLAIWRRVVDLTSQHPIEGSGLGVLRTMRERITQGDFTGELFIPNHAHNMLLQLWVETGAIGAALLAVTIVLIGWRMPAPERLGLAAPRIAGLTGGITAMACVSFDLWNEWWWACIGLLCVLSAVVARSAMPATEAQPRQISVIPQRIEMPVLR